MTIKLAKVLIVETDLPDQQFPEVCPFSFEEVLSEDFGPDSRPLVIKVVSIEA
ncbi:DUF29 family protein [Oscillatoria acuminata]|uniref:DUF29 family protein n=1 Tax=Oscillatoria acuminata TaxID=118323 RepID=UPI0002D2FFC6|nr:DUF29 family protein [Oscillatoria acuminata]